MTCVLFKEISCQILRKRRVSSSFHNKTTECRSEKQRSYSADCFANSYKIPSKKAKFIEGFCKKWQNNPQNNLAIFHFCTQQFWFGSFFKNGISSSKAKKVDEFPRCTLCQLYVQLCFYKHDQTDNLIIVPLSDTNVSCVT